MRQLTFLLQQFEQSVGVSFQARDSNGVFKGHPDCQPPCHFRSESIMIVGIGQKRLQHVQVLLGIAIILIVPQSWQRLTHDSGHWIRERAGFWMERFKECLGFQLRISNSVPRPKKCCKTCIHASAALSDS